MIVLDTCAIIWDALNKKQLTSKAKKAIQHADDQNSLLISDISLWEIAMLIKRGRLEVSITAANFLNLYLQSRNISVIPISPEIADVSVNFSKEINSDPADRLIAATTIIHKAHLVTADKNLLKNELIPTLW
jgi:PIN domain nuclease of toxin-antitoxin system